MTLRDLQRERVCFEILKVLADEDVVLIGGYAVSAYGRPRFSVDLDLVIASSSLKRIHNLLKEKGFTRDKSWDGGAVFAGKSERWKLPGPELPVSVDLLVDGLHDRGTKTSFSFEELRSQASRLELFGLSTQSRVACLVTSPEALIALKLIAGRKSDFRDIAVLARLDLRIDVVAEFLNRAPKEIARGRIEKLQEAVGLVQFRNSFQGVFMMENSSYPDIVADVRSLCAGLLELLAAA